MNDEALLDRIWTELGGGERPPIALSGPTRCLPSRYEVSELATASIAAATCAVAELHASRTGQSLPAARLDRAHASVAFRSEHHLAALGWTLPSAWDPLAGDYRTKDGWIRVHTNYTYHRDAALRALGAPPSRADVARAVATWSSEDLESAVVSAGGCAARLRTAAEWAAHPQGAAVAGEPLVATTVYGEAPALGASRLPLEGVRVLDLTRVIAGPVCTRVLAAYGAEVLRLDPPGFAEVERLLPEVTAGKRRAFLDLRASRDRFEALVRDAHVLVHGFRRDALERVGLGHTRLRELRPDLVDASLDAYGWTGPWRDRRGFDSLVQMSTGIAAGRDAPSPLPAQALDHGTGYLLAAAVCRALARRCAAEVRLSLSRTAKLLTDLGEVTPASTGELDAAPWCEEATSAFGPIRRVRCPGSIDGIDPRWTIDAGPLGVDAATWA